MNTESTKLVVSCLLAIASFTFAYLFYIEGNADILTLGLTTLGAIISIVTIVKANSK